MMAAALPTLSTIGWVTDPNILMVELYRRFMVAIPLQSNSYSAGVASLKSVLFAYKDTNALDKLITDALTHMYGNYFNDVTVTVHISPSPGDILDLGIEVVTKDDAGVVYTLSELSRINGGVIEQINKAKENIYV